MAVGEGGFRVDTNIDFNAANTRRNLLGSELEPVTPAHWLASILDARVDTALASHYSGEFYTSEQISELVRLRYSELLRKSGIASEERRSFSEVVLNNYPSIRDVINARERSFDEFLSILDRSDGFRQWAQSVHPDAKLVQEYFQELTAESWLTAFPARVVRYVLASAIGLASVPAGLAVAAMDSLLLDKIVGGWRPSHFVEGKLKPFLKEDGGA